MSRDKLDKEMAAKLEEQLPNVQGVRTQALGFRPDMISLGFPLGSTIPIAAVCLQDSTSTLQAVRYALLEALAHLYHYRERVSPSDERGAAFFGRFYVDDAALRLYAASEHLAEAVTAMLEIKTKDLEPFAKRGQTNEGSRQRLVGKFLLKTRPDHPISIGVRNLIETKEWLATIDYRNQWVHSKPPIVKGLGIEYERRNRLEVTEHTIGISVGGGDEASYCIDELVELARLASFALVELTDIVNKWYANFLDEKQKIRF